MQVGAWTFSILVPQSSCSLLQICAYTFLGLVPANLLFGLGASNKLVPANLCKQIEEEEKN